MKVSTTSFTPNFKRLLQDCGQLHLCHWCINILNKNIKKWCDFIVIILLQHILRTYFSIYYDYVNLTVSGPPGDRPPSGFFVLFRYNFPINISAWNLVGCCKTPKFTFSASWVGLVGKWLDPQSTTEFSWYSVFGPPTKEISTFLIITAQVRSSQTLWCRTFVSNMLGLGL